LAKEFVALMGEAQAEQARKDLTNALLMAAEQVGNVRLDAVTIGLSGRISDTSGFVVMVARGKYDAAGFKKMLLDTAPGRAKTEMVDGVEVVRPTPDAVLILPSDECLVFLAGPPRDESVPVSVMAAAVKSGRGQLTPESELGQVVSSVDTAAPLWVAAKMTDTYRQASLLAPFDTMTLVATDQKDGLVLKLLAKGADADKVAAAVAEFNTLLQTARDKMAQAKEGSPMPIPKPLVDFVASVQVASQGSTATATAQMKAASMTPVLLPWFMMRAVADRPMPGPSLPKGLKKATPDQF